MCYTRRDRRFEEDVRSLRSEEEARSRGERDVHPAIRSRRRASR
jgi:hypothetical protein